MRPGQTTGEQKNRSGLAVKKAGDGCGNKKGLTARGEANVYARICNYTSKEPSSLLPASLLLLLELS